MTASSFVHLHVHTEYSMLDGAAKITPLMAETARLDMPAVGMTDHGNMFGAYEFFQQAGQAGVKPIIGIEAYVAPETRFLKKPVFWAESGRREVDLDGEGGDVSGGGAYTHMTMLAADADGLRNLFRLSSVASLEGFYRKPRMDRELIAEHARGIIATTGCPSGEVQTRLRLGQPAKALEAAAAYRDIFGPENFFLELMEHGLAIERSVRQGLLDIAQKLNLRPLATNDSHYVTQDQAPAHEVLLCVGTGKTMDDPKRFKLEGGGYYIKSPAEMREIWDGQVPGACDSTLLIAERVQPYDDVFKHVDRMPRFPVPDGETQSSWLRKEVADGIRFRFGASPSQEILDRIEYELSVIEKMGFPAYFLVVADICQHARASKIGLGPGRGSATGSMVAYVLGITDLDPIEHSLIFERFLNPERITMPDIDLDFDERGRGDMIRYVTEKYGDDRVSQILTFGTIKAKAAVKDSCRVLGYPYAIGDRITKAFPAAVMGKEIPLSGIFEPAHERYSEAGELRALYEEDAEVKRILDTARGIEGLTRGTGVHAAGVILSSEPLADVLPIHRREDDGAIITGFPFVQCEDMGLLKMDFLGLRNLTVLADAIENIIANRGIEIDLAKLPLEDEPTYELLARGDTLGVFQLDGGPMRSLLKLMAPTAFGDIAAVLALYRPGPMAANTHINYADRKNGRQKVEPDPPRAGAGARADPGRDLPPGRLPGAGHGHRPAAGRVLAGPRRPAAPGDGQEEEGDPGRELGGVRGRDEGQRLLRAGHQGHLGRAGAVLRLRLQQVPHRRLRDGLVLDRLPQGQLPGRVHGRAAHLGGRRQGPDGGLPGRVPQAGHQGAAAGRQRVQAGLHPRRHRHPVRARRDPQRREPRWSTRSWRPGRRRAATPRSRTSWTSPRSRSATSAWWSR